MIYHYCNRIISVFLSVGGLLVGHHLMGTQAFPGKSTLLNLLAKLEEPCNGEVVPRHSGTRKRLRTWFVKLISLSSKKTHTNWTRFVIIFENDCTGMIWIRWFRFWSVLNQLGCNDFKVAHSIQVGQKYLRFITNMAVPVKKRTF